MIDGLSPKQPQTAPKNGFFPTLACSEDCNYAEGFKKEGISTLGIESWGHLVCVFLVLATFLVKCDREV